MLVILVACVLWNLAAAVAAAAQDTGYVVHETGSLYSTNYSAFIMDKDGPISPFHDIPLYANKKDGIFNMIVEIPRWTNAKMEINKDEPLNPIKQDMKKGKVRFVHDLFPYHGYIWNYGAFPQTWEDPNHKDPHTGNVGDNDPIDVCDISSTVAKLGEVRQVKVLGVIGLIDEGETDWKIIVINVKDPLASLLNDIPDVEKSMPGLLKATHNWLKFYKVPAGKPANTFAFKGEFKSKKFTLDVIEQTHQNWLKLIMGSTDNNDGISLKNVAVTGSPYNISREEAQQIVDQAPKAGDAVSRDPSVDVWHFVKLSQCQTVANVADSLLPMMLAVFLSCFAQIYETLKE